MTVEIWEYKAAHPHMSNRDIGAAPGVSRQTQVYVCGVVFVAAMLAVQDNIIWIGTPFLVLLFQAYL
jgi:hypothetical protein